MFHADRGKDSLESRIRADAVVDRFTQEKMIRSDALLEGRDLAGIWNAEAVFTLPCTLSRGHRAKKTAITGIVENARPLTLDKRL